MRASGGKAGKIPGARPAAWSSRLATIVVGLSLGLTAAHPAHASSLSDESALALVRSLVTDGTQAITDARSAGRDASIDFSGLYESRFATELIGRRLLGVYWNAAAADERNRFVSAFGHYLAEELVAKFPTGTFEFFDAVEPARDEAAGEVLVVKSVFVTETSSNAIQWHVSDVDGAPRIFDIVLNGKSLMDDKHAEYNDFLGRNDGSISALIAFLKD